MQASAPLHHSVPTLYVHPDSTASRSVMTFAAEAGLVLDCRVIDLYAAEQAGPDLTGFTRQQPIPVLVDGDLRLTETAAILQYLADRAGSPAPRGASACRGDRRSP